MTFEPTTPAVGFGDLFPDWSKTPIKAALNPLLTYKRLSVIFTPSKVNEAFGQLKENMTTTEIKTEASCKVAESYKSLEALRDLCWRHMCLPQGLAADVERLMIKVGELQNRIYKNGEAEVRRINRSTVCVYVGGVERCRFSGKTADQQANKWATKYAK